MTLHTLTNTTIQTNQGLVEYSTIGTGTPVLFLHGGHANSLDQIAHKGFDLHRYQLITPSRPGYRKTPLAGNESPKQAAHLFVALLDALDISQVIVYGVSAGGWTALALAAGYPQKVQKLILASAVSTKWLARDSKIYKTARLMFHPKRQRLTWRMVRFFFALMPGLMTKSFFKQFSAKKGVKINPKERQELGNVFKHYGSGQGFLNDIEQNIDSAVLEKITCPTLIVHSKHDLSVAPTHAQHAHQLIEGSTLHLLDNDWGHMLWIGNDCADTLKLILDFIEG
ncbi:alpha/beta fold hydrolase [Microscilla marina]|uniref:Aromatic hydrocarbon catabolism protein n=1 Tax=Microscilla marina ATCC 23134 TaxID=313606 RepID=A1ZDX9_MICM2|nr:alpha/beta hydrolase [Microscilla marina]EAY31287.1 aromatic hydrocarbon catabolism protein [Microscilla marina ATCC 23134]